MTQTTKTVASSAVATGLALATLLAFTAPTLAFGGFGGGDNGDRTTVRNDNNATVTNTVHVGASTGYNTSGGDEGGDAARGGDARARGGDATGGDGGNGGAGGDGGPVSSGNATAYGTVDNHVNYNTTHIEGCGCDDDTVPATPWHWFYRNGGDRTTVDNDSVARVTNNLKVKAKTGGNDSDGDNGGDGGRGGDAQTNDRQQRNLWHWWWTMNDDEDGDATGGNGGNGGAGGDGGDVMSGHAYSDGMVTNTVNRNVTRIVR